MGVFHVWRYNICHMTTDRYGDQVQTVRRGEMPEFARELPDVGRVYRFATDRAGDLEYVPCRRRCRSEVDGGGRITYKHIGVEAARRGLTSRDEGRGTGYQPAR